MISVEISHKTTGICQREKVAFSKDQIVGLIQKLNERVGGVFVLSTCNRFSIYSTATDSSSLVDFFLNHGVTEDVLTVTLGVRENAIKLFETASGLQSQFYGERQILNQISAAYQLCSRLGSLDKGLDLLIRSAIHAGKVVQKKTGICKHSESIVELACSEIRRQYNNSRLLRIAVFGAGSMAKLVVNQLDELGFRNVQLVSRDSSRASAMLERYNVRVCDYTELHQPDWQADVLIGATDQRLVLPSQLFRHGQTYQLIDLGVPRNFDPSLKEVDEVNIIDLDQLHQAVKVNSMRRKGVVDAHQIVLDEVEIYMKARRRQKVSLHAGAYWNKLRDISKQESQWLLNRLPGEGDLQKQEQLIDRFSNRLLRSVSRDIFNYLNNLPGSEVESVMTDELSKMFGLGINDSK